jgi:hypothetical protein
LLALLRHAEAADAAGCKLAAARRLPWGAIERVEESAVRLRLTKEEIERLAS